MNPDNLTTGNTLTIPEARDVARELAALLEEPVKQHRKDTAQSSARRDQLIVTIGEAILRADSLLEHLPESPAEAQEEFATIRLIAQALRNALFLVMEEINPAGAWFWSAEWQAKEREAGADYAAGRSQQFASTDELEAAFATVDVNLDARAGARGSDGTVTGLQRLEQAYQDGIRDGIARGRERGIALGRVLGLRTVILATLSRRFTTVPDTLLERLKAIDSADQLAPLAGRAAVTPSLEEFLHSLA